MQALSNRHAVRGNPIADRGFWLYTAGFGVLTFSLLLFFTPEKWEAKAIIALMYSAFLWAWWELWRLKVYWKDERRKFGVVTKNIRDSVLSQPIREAKGLVSAVTGCLESGREKGVSDCYVATHINAVISRATQPGAASASNSYAEYLSDIKREEVRAGISLIRFVAWLIPTIGFAGTVLGMRGGMSRITGIMRDNNTDEMLSVIGEFGLAFDATLYALVLSAWLVWVISRTEKMIDHLVVSVDQFIIHEILQKVPNSDRDSLERERTELDVMLVKHLDALKEVAQRIDDASRGMAVSSQPFAQDIESAAANFGAEMNKSITQLDETLKAWGAALPGIHGLLNGISGSSLSKKLDTIISILADSQSKYGVIDGRLANIEKHVRPLEQVLDVQLSKEQISAVVKEIRDVVQSVGESNRREMRVILGLEDLLRNPLIFL